MTLVKIDQYAALANKPQEILDLIRDNLGGDAITDRNLDRVTLPLGGGLNWAVPTLTGEDSIKTIEGIIVHWTRPRAYWASSMEDGGNSPPDCSSDDGDTGTGNPGGDCFTCPYSQWGTAERGNGKACKEKRMLFILRPHDILPMVIQAPSTSIGNIKTYLLRLASAGIPYHEVVTGLSIERATSGGGISYGRITPKMEERVPDESLKKLRAYVAGIKPLLSRAAVSLDVE